MLSVLLWMALVSVRQVRVFVFESFVTSWSCHLLESLEGCMDEGFSSKSTKLNATSSSFILPEARKETHIWSSLKLLPAFKVWVHDFCKGKQAGHVYAPKWPDLEAWQEMQPAQILCVAQTVSSMDAARILVTHFLWLMATASKMGLFFQEQTFYFLP